jgi:hypothetical protein
MFNWRMEISIWLELARADGPKLNESAPTAPDARGRGRVALRDAQAVTPAGRKAYYGRAP